MNENVWDSVRTWQALLPGSVTECPEKLPAINLLVPEFLRATSHVRRGSRLPVGCWPMPENSELHTHGGSGDKTLRGHSRLPSVYLLYPPPSLSIRKKVESAALSGVLVSAIFHRRWTPVLGWGTSLGTRDGDSAVTRGVRGGGRGENRERDRQRKSPSFWTFLCSWLRRE